MLEFLFLLIVTGAYLIYLARSSDSEKSEGDDDGIGTIYRDRGGESGYYRVTRHIRHDADEYFGNIVLDDSTGKMYRVKNGEVFDEVERCDSEGNPVNDIPSFSSSPDPEVDNDLSELGKVDLAKKIMYSGEKKTIVYHGTKDGKDVNIRISDNE